ncbi:MAG: imidazole glycerol phosphate synthase subunit HisH [Planctomycetota bacterium]|nr:imidazole glycerol phosphate synthase subunit HisH [Planctomycetota bacterium]
MEIAIIDYGIGNLRSAEKALQFIGLDAKLTRNPADLRTAKKIVLPGVGAFGQCVHGLRACGFVEPVVEAVKAGKPLLGICVGMQMLFAGSEESPDIPGLGLLNGSVVRFRGQPFEGPDALKIPQIGWNALELSTPVHPLFAGIVPGSHVYFVHSYHAQPADGSDALACADYGGRFCASAGRGNVMGVQFHPEKSQTVGLQILRNFGSM